MLDKKKKNMVSYKSLVEWESKAASNTSLEFLFNCIELRMCSKCTVKLCKILNLETFEKKEAGWVGWWNKNFKRKEKKEW